MKDFIKAKLSLLKKDKQKIFLDLGGELDAMSENNITQKHVKISSDGNWFELSFDTVSERHDRLVISAQRIKNGFVGDRYMVAFNGTRAAYLYGYYEHRHRQGGWPYIHWDIRAYANSPADRNVRVYVKSFRADDELPR